MILKQLGEKIHFLNVVDMHTTPQLESSPKKRYPHIVFYFNHGNKQANKQNCKEGKKGTMIAVVEGLVKLEEFKIHKKGQLATLDFQLGARDYRFISVYAPPERETSSSLVYFKKSLGIRLRNCCEK